jgi:nucleoid-associated protein YgaU
MAKEQLFVEVEKARAAVNEALSKVADIQKQIDDMKAKLSSSSAPSVELISLNVKLQEAEKAVEEAKKAASAVAVKHVWTKDDTYASLAQEYYGSFQEPYWRLIYEDNKDIIGAHPNNIRVGQEIEIPPLPPELRKT